MERIRICTTPSKSRLTLLIDSLIMYKLTNTIPFNELGRKHLRYLNMAIDSAEKSEFNSSLRLGSCLVIKGECLLWGKYVPEV